AENQHDSGEQRVTERQRQHFERELETMLDALVAVFEKPRIERRGHGAQRHRGGVDNSERGVIQARDRRAGEIGDYRLIAVAERAVGGEIEAELETEREFLARDVPARLAEPRDDIGGRKETRHRRAGDIPFRPGGDGEGTRKPDRGAASHKADQAERDIDEQKIGAALERHEATGRQYMQSPEEQIADNEQRERQRRHADDEALSGVDQEAERQQRRRDL